MSGNLPVHPFTGLTAIGFRRNGAPIWPIKGGSDDAPEGDSGSQDAPPADDFKAKYEGQQKVNRDLEKRTRADQKAIEKLTAELEQIRAGSAPKDEVEQSLDKARKEAAAEATATANRRVVRAEVKAAAAGKFADPADAVAFLDLDAFTVDDEGEVDQDAVRAALDDLLEKKPHLAAKGAGRWAGNGDGGPREAAPANVSPGIGRLTYAYASKAK